MAALIDFLRLYRLHHPNVGAQCFEQYLIAVRGLEKHLGRTATVGDLTPEVCGEYMAALRDSGLSARTVNNRRGVLRTLSRFAALRGVLPGSIEVGRLRECERIPNAFTVAEMRRILDAAAAAPPLPRRVSMSRRGGLRWTGEDWQILILLIWETGHRVKALLNCPRSAVSADGFLVMPAELTKSRREQRHKLSPTLRDLIAQRIPAGARLLSWPLTARSLWHRFGEDVLRPAGIEPGRRVKFHALRRTSASHFLRAAGDPARVSRHLGHADARVTQRYIDPSVAFDEIEAVDVLPVL